MMRAEFEAYAGIVLLRRSADGGESGEAGVTGMRGEMLSADRRPEQGEDVYVDRGYRRDGAAAGQPEQVMTRSAGADRGAGHEGGSGGERKFSRGDVRGAGGREPGHRDRARRGGVLSELPLSVLELSPEHAELFAHWGIRTLGQLAELPEVGLITRLGQQGKRLRQLARGECPHLFAPVASGINVARVHRL